MYDLKIINSKIIDMETGEEKTCDIGIKDGIIVDVGNCHGSGEIEIDANLNITSPAFIDIHIHEEEIDNVIKTNSFDVTNKMILEGVTTAVAGNCGSNKQSIKKLADYINNCGAPINYLSYVGHRYLRGLAGNIDPYSKASERQIKQMAEEVNKSLEDGAIGISFGLEYSPGADFEEIISLLDLVKNRDILLAAHYRKDAKYGIDSIKELIEVSKCTSLPMQISHIGSCTAFGMMEESLEIVQNAVDEGIDLLADCYPYDAFEASIGSPVFDEGCFELWNKSYDSIMLSEGPYRGKRCDKNLFLKLREEYPTTLAIAYVMNEDEVIKALQAAFVMIGSDGFFKKNQGHPRGAGTFPRVFKKYVREMNKLSLRDALRKMTVMPAERLGLANKGKLKVGFDADIVIFNPETVADKATFDEPTIPPEGIKYVIVGGKVAVEDNVLLNNRLGRFIERKQEI